MAATDGGRLTTDSGQQTIETVRGHIYDFPKYYDLVFGSDWKAEFDFLRACFDRFAQRTVRRVFEPACGTGRLLIKLAQAGCEVAGNDLNPKAVAFCNSRLARHGFEPSAVVGDMADFRLPRKVDAAFNTINSFRHLPDERSAESHLRCVARALGSGGLYVLGLHLTPTVGDRIEQEEWSARRGNLAVVSSMWSDWIDLKRRREHVGMSFDVHTPTRRFRIEDDMTYRTYTARQMRALLRRVPEFELAETFDFAYDLDAPIQIGAETEDVLFVLRKRRSGLAIARPM
ncbi:MAG: class I SAM-dependent methyltransferase [Planctomycetales bacterium]